MELFAWPKSLTECGVLIIISGFFSIGGIAHFTNTRFFLNIMPPQVPFPLFWVYFTGVCEIVGALGLWFSATRVWAAWSLIALCIGVYPANLYMAMNPARFTEFSQTALYMRLPLQFIIMYGCYYLALSR